MKKYIKQIHIFIFSWLPVLLYFGERSYIAQDEGYYALQARWILEKNNWLAPMWWGEISFDRTIGTQWLIAISQRIFGATIFSTHVPSLLCAFITLLITYELSKRYLGEDYKWLSPIILCCTYLWVNNAHLASQDMPLLSLEMIGIYSLTTNNKKYLNIYNFFSGFWIGLAFLIKGVMVFLPLLALIPYIIFYKRDIYKSKAFILGILLGFLPCTIWIIFSIREYGIESVIGIINKVHYLSISDDFAAPFYYYFWNIPVNTLPWSIFSLFGLIGIVKSNKLEKRLILFIYPTLLFLMLSIFKTKTPYYALQLSPFLAISASKGIQMISDRKHQLYRSFKMISSLIGVILIVISTYLLKSQASNTLNLGNIDKTEIALIFFFIGLFWSLIIIAKKQKTLILLTIIGPYLAFIFTVQNGILSNRDIHTLSIFKQEALHSNLKDSRANIYYKDKLNNDLYSKLVKISLYSPNLGSRIKDLSEADPQDFIWINHKESKINTSQIEIIYRNKIIEPWILVRNKKDK